MLYSIYWYDRLTIVSHYCYFCIENRDSVMGNSENSTQIGSAREQIFSMLRGKSTTKQQVYDNTFTVLTSIKEILAELSSDFNEELENDDRRVRLEYRDRGKFEAEIKVASDVLIFSMHSNIFRFDKDHPIWKSSYTQSDAMNGYCGVISIYNFLADSLKYNRYEDLGYLIGRIFINRSNHYFVEGKRQMGFLYNSFGTAIISKDDLQRVIQTAMLYSLEFDLLVPPYDAVVLATVGQMNSKIESTGFQTGKRLGFKFNSDDVLAKDKHDTK